MNGKIRLNFSFIIEILIATVSMAICLSGNLGEGYEIICLLPVSFLISRVLFDRAYSYRKDNLAFIILFFSIYARYLATPVLMSISNSSLKTVSPTPFYIRLAIIVQTIELFVVLLLVDLVWSKHIQKNKQKVTTTNTATPSFKLSILGLGFLALLAIFVFSRGHIDNVISHLSTWWKISEDFSDLYTYDMMALELVKNILGITVISFFAKIYGKCNNRISQDIMFFGALTIGLSMTMVYQYTARTALLQLILSVMMMLLAAFPNKKHIIKIIFGFGGVLFVALVFASGSMDYTIGMSTDSNFVRTLANMGQLYASGPDMVAITLQNTDSVRELMSISTFFSDLFNTTHIFGMVPFLRGVLSLVSAIPTSNQLFVDSLGGLTYILPNCSFWTYYGGIVFGGIFEAIAVFFTLKVICYVENKKKTLNDLYYVFVISYVEVLLGQAFFVNNTFLLWHAFTFDPLWMLIFVAINRVSLSKKHHIK